MLASGILKLAASNYKLETFLRNPLTFHVESWVGSVFVLLFSAFLVGLFAIAVKNFGSDTEVLASSSTKLKTVSTEERTLIDAWLGKTDTGISVREVGYRYIIKKYPDKPWLDR